MLMRGEIYGCALRTSAAASYQPADPAKKSPAAAYETLPKDACRER